MGQKLQWENIFSLETVTFKGGGNGITKFVLN